MGGDITRDVSSESSPERGFCNISDAVEHMHTYKLPQDHESPTVLDLLFRNQNESLLPSGCVVADISRHLPVFLVVEREMAMNSMRMPIFDATQLITPKTS